MCVRSLPCLRQFFLGVSVFILVFRGFEIWFLVLCPCGFNLKKYIFYVLVPFFLIDLFGLYLGTRC